MTSTLLGEVLRILPAMVSPILTAFAEQALWPLIHPFAWFLFYPAVILSSWIGGLRGGIVATLLSALLGWWWCLPPQYVLIKNEPRYYFPAAIFLLVSVAISLFQGRLKKKTLQINLALKKARETGNRLRAAHDAIARLFEQASDGIFLANLSGNLIDANAAACRLLGYSKAEGKELLGQSFEAFIAAANVDRFWKAKEHLLAGGMQIEEWRLRRRDGTELPVEISAKIFPDGRWQIFARDITERKIAEKRLQQVNRAHRALSRCNQALIRATDEDSLLRQVCGIIVEDAGYRMCWVGQALHDEDRRVKPLAIAGHNSDYTSSLDVTWGEDERGRGPTGTSIRTREIVITRNIADAPAMARWRAQALSHGYAASLAIPLLIDSEVFGCLSIYASEVGAFQEDEVRLLTELADDLAFGISALRTRAERARAEAELRTLNAELEERVEARTSDLKKAREQEFQIGSRIQQTLLVDQPPAHIPGVSIAALALPTQRIDGDFIIFTEPRGRTLDVIVGDVMGKGVPAALLGAATKAHLLKALGQLSASFQPGELPRPEDIVMKAHSEIARQLMDLESFVTLCYARIDPLRSVAELVDCGHTGMIRLHASTGKTDLLRGDNLPLGVRETEIYEQKTFSIQAGDSLFLFSDGITEARNASGESFGAARLQECIEAERQLAPAALVEAVRRAVVAFSGSEHLADDVTIVAIHVQETGPPIAKAERTIDSDLCQLALAREFVRSFCSGLPRFFIGQSCISSLELAVNEAASNIMKHAYRGQRGRRIEIEAEAFAGCVAIKLRHHGSPFIPKLDSPAPIDLPSESGLGLYILSQCVDEVHYYQDEYGARCVSLTKHTGRQPEAESVTPWRYETKTYRA